MVSGPGDKQRSMYQLTTMDIHGTLKINECPT